VPKYHAEVDRYNITKAAKGRERMQFQKKWIANVRRLGGVVSSSSDSHMISIRGNVTWSATTPARRSSSFGMIQHNVLVVLFPAQNPGPSRPGTDIRSHREWFLRKDKKKVTGDTK